MAKHLPLVRDVLDKQVVDGCERKIGKVDGIVLQPRAGRPPRVVAIECDQVAAWRRVWWRLGDGVERFQRWLAPDLVGPTRIPFQHVAGTGIDVHVDVDARSTNAYAWEAWVQATFIGLLPGGSGRGEKE